MDDQVLLKLSLLKRITKNNNGAIRITYYDFPVIYSCIVIAVLSSLRNSSLNLPFKPIPCSFNFHPITPSNNKLTSFYYETSIVKSAIWKAVYDLNVQALLQMNTIFISILIESLPFILLGVLISGIIQIFVSEEMIAKVIPKNPILSVLFAIFAGVFFLACECGIVPITRRLIAKGVPLSAAIAFMLSAPILNPIVLFSTYIAFGNNWSMVIYRGGIALLVVLIIACILSFQFKTNQLKHELIGHTNHHSHTVKDKITGMFKHSIEEFFSVGKYLIIGALLAAAIQTFLKTSLLLEIGQGNLSGNVVMMALSYVMSLCSQADAFVASSFRSTFSTSSIVAFLVFGAMFDIKNTIMLLGTFKTKFVLCLMAYIFISVLGLTLLFIS